MSLYKSFKTDAKLETEGRWFDIKPANDDGTVPGFLLARSGSRNIPFQKAMERIQRENKAALDNGTMDPDDAQQLLVDMFIKTLLRDWRNVQSEDNSEMVFSEDNARKLFTDLPDLFTVLRNQAGVLTNYQDKLIAAAGKN